LWNELRFFARDFTPTGMITYRASTGYDDCTMAWMISLKCSDDENFSKYFVPQEAKAPEMDKSYYDSEGLFPSNENSVTGPWN
jgi:hypothetical protein